VTNEEETDLFQFSLVTGGREQGVSTATWADIDFDLHEFLIQDRRDLDWSSKDREEGGIPIPDDFIERIQARRLRNPESRLIFPNTLGKPEGHFLRQLQNLAKREGLNCGGCVNRKGESCAGNAVCSNWGLHRFRKTFATFHHDNGVPVRTIQRWLRRSSEGGTRRRTGKVVAAELAQPTGDLDDQSLSPSLSALCSLLSSPPSPSVPRSL